MGKYVLRIQNLLTVFRMQNRRSVDLIISLTAFSLLIAMSLLVKPHEVLPWEVTTFRVINELPDQLYYVIWPFMQYGVFITIPVIATIAAYFKKIRLSLYLFAGGIGIYFAARYFKELFPRGRPADLLNGVITREEFAPLSKGFTSGHTAVASTIATFSHYYLTYKWQVISIGTLVLVLFGRVYVGAHFPLDVLGGVALGLGTASLINYAIGVPKSATAKREDTREWIVQHRPRHPGDIIRIAIATMLFALTTVAALTGVVSGLEEAVFRTVNYLPEIINPIVQIIMQFGALYFVFIAAIIALIFRHNRLFIKIVSGGSGVWIASKIAKALVDRERPFYLLQEIIQRGSNSGLLGFPSGHAAVAALISTVSAPYISKRWSRVLWSAAWVTALGRIFVGAHLPLDVIAGLSLGWASGSLLNLAFGTPEKPWPKQAIIKSLRDANLAIRVIKKAEVDARGSVPLFAKTVHGKEVFIKIIDSEHRNADVLFRVWRFLTLRAIQDEAPFMTAKHQAEHEAYVSIQASQAHVKVPQVLLCTQVNQAASIIVSEKINGKILPNASSDLDVALLKRIWKEVKKLHDARIAHRDLRATNIIIDNEKQPWLIDFSFAQSAAPRSNLALDIVELIVSLSFEINYTHVVSSAVNVLGVDNVKEAIPYMQRAALSKYSRQRLKTQNWALEELIQELLTQTNSRKQMKIRLHRLQTQWLFFGVIATIAMYVIFPQINELNDRTITLSISDAPYVLGVLAASIMTYVFSAIVVVGATTKSVSFWQVLLVQIGSSVINRVTPKGLGGVVLLERFLEKQKVDRTVASTIVLLPYFAGGLVHMVLSFVAIVMVRPTLFSEITILKENSLTKWIAIFSVFLASLGLLYISSLNKFIKKWLQDTRRYLGVVLNSPAKSLSMIGGSVGVTLSYALALYLSIEAFNLGLSFDKVLLVYLLAGFLSAAAPTPGGLGATEASLVAGLSLYGLPLDHAVAAVLLFRLATFWLPILPGFLSLRYLRARHLV